MKKEDFNSYYRLLPQQGWLSEKESELTGLIKGCKTKEQKKLLFSLLEKFQYVDYRTLAKYLDSVADYIINDTGFDISKTQIVGMTIGSEPDSSQWLLQLLKPVLTRKGWNNVKIITNFTRGVRTLNKDNLNQIVLVDEFIGSGQSVEGRMKYLKENAKRDYEIKACFIAGMEKGIKRVSDSFIDFKCFLPQSRGISDNFIDNFKIEAIKYMTELESYLLPNINENEMKDYHLGFNSAEALYSSYGNTPNSVFPFFWWPYDINSKARCPILVRNEDSFGL